MCRLSSNRCTEGHGPCDLKPHTSTLAHCMIHTQTEKVLQACKVGRNPGNLRAPKGKFAPANVASRHATTKAGCLRREEAYAFFFSSQSSPNLMPPSIRQIRKPRQTPVPTTSSLWPTAKPTRSKVVLMDQ
mmetsp:Transcript_99504/g.197170  ORF Transcript_99504/g.197170 Transcript_99504/m.197170 type:complete len:131 (-) Transcript_99504:266-658(-)